MKGPSTPPVLRKKSRETVSSNTFHHVQTTNLPILGVEL